MKLNFDEHISLKFDSYQKLTEDQKIKVFRAVNQLNIIIDEVDDDDNSLHIYNVPHDLMSRINAYNRTHRNDTINITAVCVNALQSTLDDVDRVWDEPAAEMEDDPEDIDGNILEVGDRVSFTICGPDAHNHFEGVVFLRLGEYCIKSGEQNWVINNELLALHKLPKPYTMEDYEAK